MSTSSPTPAPSDPMAQAPAPSTGLLSSYDRIRRQVVGALAKRGGRIGAGAAEALMLVPDVFVLLGRLSLDPEVPAKQRALFGGAVAYFLLPADLFPEIVVGGVGFLDDLLLGALVLSSAFGDELDARTARHWSGRGRLRDGLKEASKASRLFLGPGLSQRVESMGRRWARSFLGGCGDRAL